MTAPVEVEPLPPLPPVLPAPPTRPDPPMGPMPGPGIRQTAYCPTCGQPVPGLLALCWQPGCITAFLDDDARYDQ